MSLLFMLPHIVGMTGTCHHAQLFLLRWGLTFFFFWGAGLVWNCNLPALNLAKWWMADALYHVQLLVKMRFCELFAQTGLKP
jgi:hypothetical protein